jgi:hypothetical protein
MDRRDRWESQASGCYTGLGIDVQDLFTSLSVVSIVDWLVVWNMNFVFPYIGNLIIPTDELIFFKGVGIPPTSEKY